MPSQDTKIESVHVGAFLEAFGEVSPVFHRKAASAFETEGIDPEESDGLVNYQHVVNAVASIAEDTGSSSMYEAGKSVARNMPVEDASSPEEALSIFNEVHTSSFEDPQNRLPAGKFTWEEQPDGTLRVSATSQYPYGETFPHGDAFTRGTLEAVLEPAVEHPDARRVDTKANESIAFELGW